MAEYGRMRSRPPFVVSARMRSSRCAGSISSLRSDTALRVATRRHRPMPACSGCAATPRPLRRAGMPTVLPRVSGGACGASEWASVQHVRRNASTAYSARGSQGWIEMRPVFDQEVEEQPNGGKPLLQRRIRQQNARINAHDIRALSSRLGSQVADANCAITSRDAPRTSTERFRQKPRSPSMARAYAVTVFAAKPQHHATLDPTLRIAVRRSDWKMFPDRFKAGKSMAMGSLSLLQHYSTGSHQTQFQITYTNLTFAEWPASSATRS